MLYNKENSTEVLSLIQGDRKATNDNAVGALKKEVTTLYMNTLANKDYVV